MTDQQPDPDEQDPLGNNEQDPEGGDPDNEHDSPQQPSSPRERTGEQQAQENADDDPPA
jgi:hypothetical protein